MDRVYSRPRMARGCLSLQVLFPPLDVGTHPLPALPPGLLGEFLCQSGESDPILAPPPYLEVGGRSRERRPATRKPDQVACLLPGWPVSLSVLEQVPELVCEDPSQRHRVPTHDAFGNVNERRPTRTSGFAEITRHPTGARNTHLHGKFSGLRIEGDHLGHGSGQITPPTFIGTRFSSHWGLLGRRPPPRSRPRPSPSLDLSGRHGGGRRS